MSCKLTSKDCDRILAAAEGEVVLACRDLRKSFGGVPVLKGVSLSLRLGTVTALAGENGAGKSTMMKIAAGQYRADAGQVLVRDEELHGGSIAFKSAPGKGTRFSVRLPVYSRGQAVHA